MLQAHQLDITFHPGTPLESRALRALSLEIPDGQFVTVIGTNGAGKSTLVSLLLRLYDIQGGAIRIDGQDISRASLESLRTNISVVSQEPFLFNGSLRENILYGRLEATEAELQSAVEAADCLGFVQRLPAGLDTQVGERGLKLSGGEQQRVAIARTILKNPPILLFDEATSALDTATEREIQAQLDAIAKNRTTLVIAHRLSTVVGADQILVMDAGRVVERGTHEQLLAHDGAYAKLWALQQAEAEAA